MRKKNNEDYNDDSTMTDISCSDKIDTHMTDISCSRK